MCVKSSAMIILMKSSTMMNHPPPEAAAVHNVFVYGSLLADDVVRILLKRVPLNSPATLNNYQRFSVKGRVYPAILPVESNKVAGRILCGITDPELNILDIFEDDEYERKVVEVALKDGAERSETYTYVWANQTDPDLYGEWNFEVWKQLHMEDFMKMTMKFVEELELPDSKTRVATYESFYQQADNGPSIP